MLLEIERSEKLLLIEEELEKSSDPRLSPTEEATSEILPEKHKGSREIHEKFTRDVWWEGAYRNSSAYPKEENFEFSEGEFTANPYVVSNNFPVAGGEAAEAVCKGRVRAEVRLLIKTMENGKEAVEVMSVKELVEGPSGKSVGSKKQRAKTLPCNFKVEETSRGRNFYKTSSDTYLGRIVLSKESDVPTYTLQRFFVRGPKVKVEGDKTKINLFAEQKQKFPLQFDRDAGDVESSSSAPAEDKSETFFKSSSDPFPQPYCFWLNPTEERRGGNDVDVPYIY